MPWVRKKSNPLTKLFTGNLPSWQETVQQQNAEKDCFKVNMSVVAMNS